jgi:hypothetical protein
MLDAIPAPRVPFIDERTNLVSREWYRFLVSLRQQVVTDTTLVQAPFDANPQSVDVLSLLASASGDLAASLGAPPAVPAAPIYYGNFSSSVTQAPAVINTAYGLTFNTTALSFGVRASGSQVICDTGGLYRFDLTVQLDDPTGGPSQVRFWPRRNGVTAVPDSASLVQITAETVFSRSYFLQMAAGEFVEFMYSANDLDVDILAVAAAAPVPAIPSVALVVRGA